MTKVQLFLRDTSGATAIEYAMLGGFISLAIVVAVTSIGTRLNSKFAYLASNFS